MDKPIYIDAEAILRVFDKEHNEVLGLFTRQIECLGFDTVTEPIMRVWLEGYYSGRNHAKEE